jgi:hypothetical protein
VSTDGAYPNAAPARYVPKTAAASALTELSGAEDAISAWATIPVGPVEKEASSAIEEPEDALINRSHAPETKSVGTAAVSALTELSGAEDAINVSTTIPVGSVRKEASNAIEEPEDALKDKSHAPETKSVSTAAASALTEPSGAEDATNAWATIPVGSVRKEASNAIEEPEDALINRSHARETKSVGTAAASALTELSGAEDAINASEGEQAPIRVASAKREEWAAIEEPEDVLKDKSPVLATKSVSTAAASVLMEPSGAEDAISASEGAAGTGKLESVNSADVPEVAW